MDKIEVSLKQYSYPIFIGNELFQNIDFFWPLQKGDSVVLITSITVSSLYLDKIFSTLTQADIMVNRIILPDGERTKSWSELNNIITFLLHNNYNRNVILVAIGGGVIGDLTGFVASIYQRGVRYIQIPTTLLAQVDASVGGKTGINHILGKNMIGSFYQPISVLIDSSCLQTLSAREFSAGLAEIIKYGIALDGVFFSWLEDHLDDILSLNAYVVIDCIKRCCELKSKVVSIDEYDHNIRSLLNFGHTFGHAIESYLDYKDWLHGEAVSAGMMMAIKVAAYIKVFDECNIERICTLLLRSKLPVYGPRQMLPKDYLFYMHRDKKNMNHKLSLVLPIDIGNAVIFNDITDDVIVSSIMNH